MTEPARHLQVVDPSTGELHERCPDCAERQLQLDELTRKYHGALSQIGKLRADKEAEMRDHGLFPVMKRLHGLWREETGHTKAELKAAGFQLALPYLQNPKYGERYIERAIHGLAYDPLKAPKPSKNGYIEVYDQWHHLFKNDSALERYYNRAPLPAYVEMLSVELPPHERNLSRYAPDGAWLTDE